MLSALWLLNISLFPAHRFIASNTMQGVDTACQFDCGARLRIRCKSRSFRNETSSIRGQSRLLDPNWRKVSQLTNIILAITTFSLYVQAYWWVAYSIKRVSVGKSSSISCINATSDKFRVSSKEVHKIFILHLGLMSRRVYLDNRGRQCPSGFNTIYKQI